MPAQVRADFKAHTKIFLNSRTFFKDYIFYSYVIFCTGKVILNSKQMQNKSILTSGLRHFNPTAYNVSNNGFVYNGQSLK